jgi:hypothetical protein
MSKHTCYVCGKDIPKARIDALVMLGTPTNQYTHVQCSQVEKKKGVFMGEVGTSELKIVDKLYNDSVRDMFKGDSCKKDCEE